MEFKAVKSSNIQAIGYENGKLQVRFANGNTYEYAGVSDKDYKDLIDADSPGSAFHFGIKQKYEARKLDTDK